MPQNPLRAASGGARWSAFAKGEDRQSANRAVIR